MTDNPIAPLISIALCTYNGERFLEPQLETLLAQDYPNLEIVANDDGSTDGSFAILQRYAARDPRVKPLRNPSNLGYLRNFETCVRRCHGELIALSDQDDLWHPAKISRLLARLGPDDMAAYCDSELVDENAVSLGRTIADTRRRYEGDDPLAFVFTNTAPGHALLFRRRLLDSALPFPHQGFHDWWLAAAAAAGGGIRYLPEPLVQFRQHASSQTDMAGRKKRVRPDGVQQFENFAFWLANLARLEGSRQGYLQALLRRWLKRADHWFVPSLPLLLSRQSAILGCIDRENPLSARLRWWRYVWGMPAKQWLNPRKYPRRPLRLPTVAEN